jgi:hypothetical protein
LLIEQANGWRCFRFEEEVTTETADEQILQNAFAEQ